MSYFRANGKVTETHPTFVVIHNTSLIVFQQSISRIEQLTEKFSDEELILIQQKTLLQYANILSERWATETQNNKILIERIFEYRIDKYLDFLSLTDNIHRNNERFLELRGNSVLYLERLISKKYNFYQRGSLGMMIIFGLIIDLSLYWIDVFNNWFIPVATITFIISNRINFISKRRKNLVIEDEI